MTTQPANTLLHESVYRFGFFSAIAVFITAVAAIFFPLDVPSGYSAEHSERLAWLVEHRGSFIAGWANQMIAMFALSAVFAASAWHASPTHPLRALLAGCFVLISVVAFVIPKFIALWTIPLLVDAISIVGGGAGAGSEMAAGLLPLLNVSVPFSLFTSFDYLGFWSYALFALLVAGALFSSPNATTTQKIGAVALGLYGIGFHVVMIGLFIKLIGVGELETAFLSISVLLLVHVICMVPVFRRGF